MPYWFEPQSVSLELGGRTMTIETGRVAKQAQGAALVTYGDTVVLVAATRSKPRPGIDFFPLTVDFIEKYAAAGRIPGSFFRREARLSDREVLVSRFIDRSIRPLFADGYNDDTQITCTVLSASEDASPDMAAFVGASAALHISQIPFLGPIGALRVGRVDGEFVEERLPFGGVDQGIDALACAWVAVVADLVEIHSLCDFIGLEPGSLDLCIVQLTHDPHGDRSGQDAQNSNDDHDLDQGHSSASVLAFPCFSARHIDLAYLMNWFICRMGVRTAMTTVKMTPPINRIRKGSRRLVIVLTLTSTSCS